MRRVILLLGLLLVAVPASADPIFPNDLHQDGIIYDFKDFVVFASIWGTDLHYTHCEPAGPCFTIEYLDFNDLMDFANHWLFITADDLAAVMAARDAADAGFEHARLYMIDSFDAAPDKSAWLDSWYDPATAEVGYSFGPEPQGEAEFQYEIYKGNELTGYEIVSTGTAGSIAHTVHASMLAKVERHDLGFGIRAEGSIDVRLDGELYTIPADGNLTIRTNSIISPPDGGIVLRNGLTVPGDVIIGVGGDVNEVVVAKHGVTIEGEVRPAWDELQFPPIMTPPLPPGVLTQDPNDSDVWIISTDGEFGPLNIGTNPSDPVIIKIDGNNGIDPVSGAAIPLEVYINGDLILGAAAQLIVTQGSAVELYIGRALEAKNGSVITYEGMPENPDPVADEALIIEATKSLTIRGTQACDSIILRNLSDFYGLIYASEAHTEIRNQGDFYGAIINSGEAEVSNSGDFYYVAPFFDLAVVEIIYIGIKRGSWWEDFVSQPDIVKGTFESVVR